MSDSRSRDNLSTCSLLVVAVVLASFLASSLIATTQTAVAAGPTLVNTIDTSRWNPPSPDPSGITYWPARNHLLIVDGEVEEMSIWAGANVFRSTLQGSLQKTYNTTSFSNEPVGVDIDVAPNGNIFISDDIKKTIWEIALGADRELGTSDDVRRSFLTSSFGNNDPEGLTVAQIGGKLKLFTVDGAGIKVWISDPGPNGQFDGAGDDVVTSFGIGSLGVQDPEGIDYASDTGTLWIVDRGRDRLHEVTTSGQPLRMIDLRTFIPGVLNPADVTIAPGSQDSSVKNFYIVERGVDNNGAC